YVVKINNYGKFAHKPKLKYAYKNNSVKPLVTIEGDGAAIHYTLDGSEPTLQSPLYLKPFEVEKTGTLIAKAFPTSGLNSATATEKVVRYEWLKPWNVASPQPGLIYNYYEPADPVSLESINNNKAIKTGTTSVISNSLRQRAEKFVLTFDGYIKITKDGFHTFFTDSDDGSKLFIDDNEVVNNDGNHGNTEKSGRILLRKGFHKIKVLFFDGAGNNSLNVSMQPDGGKKVIIPGDVLFH
ncbi:MAG: chitobiase/beta-hexosaminidase C-terminal domain-containing protein, partial [Bacteroidetes bacterium]|nr:chitobiase/beta-hexosaminidase C-terminal domain-containing protein [Bacteroidota bacterium]